MTAALAYYSSWYWGGRGAIFIAIAVISVIVRLVARSRRSSSGTVTHNFQQPYPQQPQQFGQQYPQQQYPQQQYPQQQYPQQPYPQQYPQQPAPPQPYPQQQHPQQPAPPQGPPPLPTSPFAAPHTNPMEPQSDPFATGPTDRPRSTPI